MSIAWPTSGAPVVGYNRLAGPPDWLQGQEPVFSVSHGFLNPYNNLTAYLDLLRSGVTFRLLIAAHPWGGHLFPLKSEVTTVIILNSKM